MPPACHTRALMLKGQRLGARGAPPGSHCLEPGRGGGVPPPPPFPQFTFGGLASLGRARARRGDPGGQPAACPLLARRAQAGHLPFLAGVQKVARRGCSHEARQAPGLGFCLVLASGRHSAASEAKSLPTSQPPGEHPRALAGGQTEGGGRAAPASAPFGPGTYGGLARKHGGREETHRG